LALHKSFNDNNLSFQTVEDGFEDQHFFELATGCRALSIFEDLELSLPQPESFSQRQSEEKSKLHTDIVALEDYRASLVLRNEQAPALLVSNGH